MSLMRTDATRQTRTTDPPRTRRGFWIRDRVRRRLRRRRVAWAAALVAVALSLGGAVTTAPAASAATRGAGFGTWAAISPYGWHGAMIIDGVSTYCISPGLPAPVGASTKVGITGAVAGLTATQLTRINLLVSKYGQTRDDVRAASVAWAVKAIADWKTTLHEFGYRGDSLAGAINWTFSALSPANNSAIQRLATTYYAEAMATPASIASGSGALTFTTDEADQYRGTVRAAAPTKTTGTIELTNGRFVDNGTSRLAGAVAGREYRIVGVPPTDDGEPYEISGTGRFGTGYGAAVALYRTKGQQNTAGPGGSAAFTVAGKDQAPRSVTFRPALTSRTAKVSPDGRLTDTLTFTVAAGPGGVINSWFRHADGTSADVHFTVTAYGPLDRTPAEAADVPAETPVADVAHVSTGTSGDSAPVTATFTKVQPGGVYSFVAEYDPTRTPDSTKKLLPKDYRWKHAFGMAVETTLVPMQLRLSSRIAASRTALSGTNDDTVTVEHTGAWPRDRDGAPIPVVLRGQYVHIPEDATTSATKTLPDGGTILGETTLTISADGDYQASAGGALPRNPAAPADAAHPTAGRTAWRWAVVSADQPGAHRGWIRETAEEYGVASQTSTIELPVVTTMAQAGFPINGSAKDSALVKGTLPVGGAELAFSAYAVPMVESAGGRWLVDAPANAKAGDLSWVCTKENLVFTDVGHGRRITVPGQYASPLINPPAHRKILWVETLRTIPSAGRPSQPIHSGECGLPHETSYGVDVTTRATSASGGSDVRPDDRVFDTATASGYVPEGGAITFRVYAWPTGGTPVCTASTLQTTLKPAVPRLTGGLYPDDAKLSVASEQWKVPSGLGGMTLGFVEVLADHADRIVHTGTCGAASETVPVVGPRVNTGGATVSAGGHDTPGPMVWMLSALGAVVLASGVVTLARSRSKVTR